jgi:hypothetical protein
MCYNIFTVKQNNTNTFKEETNMMNFKKVINNIKNLVDYGTIEGNAQTATKYDDYDTTYRPTSNYTTTSTYTPIQSSPVVVISDYDENILNKINTSGSNSQVTAALNELFNKNEYVVANTLKKVNIIVGTQVYNLIANKLTYRQLNNILRNDGEGFIETLETIVNQSTDKVWEALFSFIKYYSSRSNELTNLCDTLIICNRYMNKTMKQNIADLAIIASRGSSIQSESKLVECMNSIDEETVNYLFQHMPSMVKTILTNPANISDAFLSKMPSTVILQPSTDTGVIARYLSCTPFNRITVRHLEFYQRNLIYKALQAKGYLYNCNLIMYINLIVCLGTNVPTDAFNLYLKRILDMTIVSTDINELKYIDAFTKKRCDVELKDMIGIRKIVTAKLRG